MPGRGGAWSLVLGGGCGEPPKTATAVGGTHHTGMHSCRVSISFCVVG